MEIEKRWVTHRREGQAMQGYLATPAAVNGPLPAILVIQEIWGPDEHIQDLAQRFAQAGYVALAPDLYSRGGRPDMLSEGRIEAVKSFLNTVPPGAWHDRSQMQESLAKLPTAEGQAIGETLGRLFAPRDNDALIADLSAWLDYLSSLAACSGQPIGSIGYCMGGGLSFELATSDERIRVAQVYYGSAPALDRLSALHCPVFGFYGENDPRITGAVPEVAEAARGFGKSYSYTIYPGAPHAFFNDTRASYHVQAARDAWAKTLSIFNTALGAAVPSQS